MNARNLQPKRLRRKIGENIYAYRAYCTFDAIVCERLRMRTCVHALIILIMLCVEHSSIFHNEIYMHFPHITFLSESFLLVRCVFRLLHWYECARLCECERERECWSWEKCANRLHTSHSIVHHSWLWLWFCCKYGGLHPISLRSFITSRRNKFVRSRRARFTNSRPIFSFHWTAFQLSLLYNKTQAKYEIWRIF